MKATVLSDGAWGTALALLLNSNGHDVTLWGPFPENIAAIARDHCNQQYLPDVPVPSQLQVTADLNHALAGAELIVLATPSRYMRQLLQQLQNTAYPADAIWVCVAKGIERGTHLRMSQLVGSFLGANLKYCVLSGPSHAEEVARNIPTAVVVAADDQAVRRQVQQAFMNDCFRVYTSADVIGVELGGALKNVLAVAAGVCDGMGFGDNTKAALITRGIVEMARLGKALGGDVNTFAGLSGTGDLIVTCTSGHSRNRHVGEALGRGESIASIEQQLGPLVAEGVTTCEATYELARQFNVETPIIDQVYAILYQGKDSRRAVHDLMQREAKAETEDQWQ